MKDIDQWKKKVLTLPDSAFFDIMRNYLGEIKTPFNKHHLIEDLVSFLKRQQTLDRIISLIDERDAKLLTAIDTITDPTIDKIFILLQEETTYIELHQHLLNLAERLLIFREPREINSCIRFNPLFYNDIKEKIVNSNLLFPAVPSKSLKKEQLWLTDSLIIASLSYLLKNPSVFKLDGELKKKAEDNILEIFPILLEKGTTGIKYDILKQALINSDLVIAQQNNLNPVLEKWVSFAKLDNQKRVFFLWAAAAEPENHSIKQVSLTANLISGLIKSIPEKTSYSFKTLEKIVSIISKEEDIDDINYSSFLQTLISLNVLIPSGKECCVYNPDIDQTENTYNERIIIIQPTFDITVKPGIQLNDGFLLALISDIKHYDLFPIYEITKHSFIRGLHNGLEAENVYKTLEKLNGQPLPQNVSFSLKTWEKDYKSITLVTGVVLTADKERRHLIEHTDFLKNWVKKILAPGIYLLDPEEQNEWEHALNSAGIDPVPGIENVTHSDTKTLIFYDYPEISNLKTLNISNYTVKPAADFNEEQELFKMLFEKLQTLPVTNGEKAKLTIRIKKKLLLFPEQLHPGIERQEKTEAKGLDFQGKILLIEQTLKSETELLELIRKTSDGENKSELIRPLKLEKSGKEYLLKGKTLPEGKLIEIQVRKIVLVRRLRISLLTP